MVAVGGVLFAVYGVVLARRAAVSAGSPPASGGGLAQKVRAGGDATVAGRDLTMGRVRERRGAGQAGGGRVEQDVHANGARRWLVGTCMPR
jgi:hypothetical protein